MSATKNGFTRFDSISEFKSWLDKQSSYNYTGIQVHHTWSPNYSNFYKSNGTTEDELTRQKSMKDYHVNTNGWGDIAQHFTIFPNGKIVTGRKLSSTTAIGIKGWNSNKICIEIYGDFDKGKDAMKTAQKKAVIATYALLCKKFSITPSTSTIRAHGWFTASGTYLGDYNASKSAKTCPGTNFMGIGNTKSAFENKFIPWVKQYMKDGTYGFESASATVPETVKETACNKVGTISCSSTLNVRKGAGTSFDKIGSLNNGDSITIVATCANGWYKIKFGTGYGYVSGSYVSNVKEAFKQYIARCTADSLNCRKGPGTSYDKEGTLTKGVAITIVAEKTVDGTKWLQSKTGYWVSSKYMEFVKYV